MLSKLFLAFLKYV